MEFTLRSSAFENNSSIPEKYTCDGEEISPQLEWSDSPRSTQSFVLIVNDYDAPAETWNHWLIYNIPHNITKLSEGINTLPKPAKLGLNSWKQKNYKGPCPTELTHNYHFYLYALDSMLALHGKATRVSIEKAVQHHMLGKATLIGTYKRKTQSQPIHKEKINLIDAMTILRKKDVNQKIKEKAAKKLEHI